jgi:hypothetical protein
MVEAEAAFAAAKNQAVEALAEHGRRLGEGLDTGLTPVLPRDPVDLPPAPGGQVPSLGLRMVWRLRSLWEGVQSFAEMVHGALRRDEQISGAGEPGLEPHIEPRATQQRSGSPTKARSRDF